MTKNDTIRMVKIYNKTTMILTSVLFLSVFYVLTPIEICNAGGNTLHVGIGQTYTNIQDAIDAANESDTVYVHSGTYSETIIVDKTLNLTGDGSSSTTISGSGGHTIKISSNYVLISGFKIQNIGESFYCIFLESVTGCKILNNYVRNGGHGIYLGSSNSNIIRDNTIEDNNVGIYLSNSDSNTIRSNDIKNNNANGIFLTSSSSENTIYLNDFSNNMDSNAKDYGSNNWDYSSQGNYWDDYNDYDGNEDGIGDNPYIIPGVSNQDNNPLGDFLSPNQNPVAYIDSISPNPATSGQTINFDGRGIDDGTIVSWEWKSDGVLLASSEDFSTSSISIGTHTITFRVQDNDGLWSNYKTVTLITNPQANKKPNAFIIKPTIPTADYGENVIFEGYGGDTDGTVVEYLWWSDPEGIYNENVSFIKNDLPVDQYTIYFKVKDDNGDWSSEVSTILTILSDAPENQAPIADAGGSYNGFVNRSVIFDGSGSYDPDSGDTISYYWDFGDGSAGKGVNPTHIYTSEGNYIVQLTVIDNHGEQSKSTTNVNITLKAEDQNGGNKDNGEIPGFEIVIVLIAIAILVFWKRKGFN